MRKNEENRKKQKKNNLDREEMGFFFPFRRGGNLIIFPFRSSSVVPHHYSE
jgi:hypothetical protein